MSFVSYLIVGLILGGITMLLMVLRQVYAGGWSRRGDEILLGGGALGFTMLVAWPAAIPVCLVVWAVIATAEHFDKKWNGDGK